MLPPFEDLYSLDTEEFLVEDNYKVRVYVAHGYYEYPVTTMDQALSHGHSITSTGVYRRSNSNGEVEFHKVIKVKIIGKDLESSYTDTFKRT